MKVLLFTSKEEDYLQDSLIHGFKQLIGKEAIDFPEKKILYTDFTNLKIIHGSGFTLYGLLNCHLKAEKNFDVEKSIVENEFDLIVFTSIYRQYDLFYKYFKALKKSQKIIWIIDGEDTPVIFPYMKKHLKQFFFSAKPHNNFLYFKRELLPQTINSIYFGLPVSLISNFPLPKLIKRISFSIPQEKIINYQPVKNKLFVQDVVDEEVAKQLYGQKNRSLFNSEKDYYNDIQISKFGITTKRAGWDCLRHYEIAANGAVICFKDLDKKPDSCAPHGLIPNYNCISYSDCTELLKIVNNISNEIYLNLLQRSFNWIRAQTTIQRIKNLLSEFG